MRHNAALISKIIKISYKILTEGLAYVYNVYKSPCPPSRDPIHVPVTFERVLLNDILIAPRWWGRARKIRAEGVKSAATVAMPTSVVLSVLL